MREITLVVLMLLTFACTGAAEAQSASGKATANTTSGMPRWDVAGNAALFWVSPGKGDSPYQDDWYFSGRYAATFGHYWTEHVKTEVEYATSGETSTFTQELRSVTGVPGLYPVPIETLRRVEQGSVRMLWQFGSNAWAHPYVSGGLVVDRERERIHVPRQLQFINGRPNEPSQIVPESTSDQTFDHRMGFTAGAGAKIYMTQNAFFNGGVLATFSNPMRTFSMVAGLGIDF